MYCIFQYWPALQSSCCLSVAWVCINTSLSDLTIIATQLHIHLPTERFFCFCFFKMSLTTVHIRFIWSKSLKWSFVKPLKAQFTPPLHSLLLFFSLFMDHLLCLCAATGAAVALPGGVAGADLHRAGKQHEQPIFVLLQQRDRLSAPQTARGWPTRLNAKASLPVGPSDNHGNRDICWRGGCHIHDSQSAQCCDPGLLHVLLVSDATRVCVSRPIYHTAAASMATLTVYYYWH